MPIWQQYILDVYGDAELEISKGTFDKPTKIINVELDCNSYSNEIKSDSLDSILDKIDASDIFKMKNLKSIDIPNSPGVYKFLNSDNKILYVGKSKNLKKRVKSYFQKEQNKKISNLVKETTKIDFIISESEHDALLLENNLIKENKPKYNILLRDDKTFPYIAISKDRFPKFTQQEKSIIRKKKFSAHIPM